MKEVGNVKMFKLLKNNRGSVIVEVAVMFIIVTMLATGYIYFTQFMRVKTALKIAAKEGAREYSITNNPSKARSRVMAELSLAGIDSDTVDISISRDGKKRIVNVRARDGFYIPFAGEYDLNLRGGAEFTLEENPEIEEKGQL